jgi:hypothetical protein
MVTANAVSFVVGTDGEPIAVQITVDAWRHIVAALEDAEDVAAARAAVAELRAAGGDPQQAGWLPLEDLEKAWVADGDL